MDGNPQVKELANDTLGIKTPKSKNVVAKVHDVCWWHDTIADWLVANPTKKVRHCAEELQVSLSWISCVVNSDAFKELLRKKSMEQKFAATMTTEERIRAVADNALDQMDDTLQAAQGGIAIQTLNDVAGTALKALGYGNRNAGPSVAISVGENAVFMIGKGDLAEARERIRVKQSPKDITHDSLIEHEANTVLPEVSNA